MAIAGMAAATFAGCGPRDDATDLPTEVLVFARGSDSLRLDPIAISDGESAKVIVNVFDTLVAFAPDSLDLVPGLATAWRFADDGQSLTLTLRQGVRFHDGTPFNSDAVVFSLERIIDSANPWRPDIVQNQANYDMIASVQADGPHRVILGLKRRGVFLPARPTELLVANLAAYAASIVAPSAVRRLGAQGFARAPVGTGAFAFVSWRPDERLVLAANAEHWRGPPPAAKVVFLSLRDNTVRLAALTRGEADIIDGLDLKDLAVVRADPNLQLHSRPGITVCYLAINNRRWPFSDAGVRRALALAIDKTALAQRAYYGEGTVARSIVPPSLWGHAGDLPANEYDPTAARALLAQAGLPGGFACDLWVMDYPRPYVPDPRRAGEVLKEMLRAVGIRVRLRSPDWASYLKGVENAAHDLALLGWSMDTADPDTFLYNLLHSRCAVLGAANNITFYGQRRGVFLPPAASRVRELDDLIDTARYGLNRSRRIALYQAAQHLAHSETPLVPLMHTPFLTASRRTLTGYQLHPSNNVYLRQAALVASD